MNLENMIPNISSKDELVRFISELINDLRNNPDTWENLSLENYLQAMQSWLEDIEGWEKNCNTDTSKMTTWQLIACILIASKMYE